MSSETIEFLDECWAACLGCSAAQLRDGGRHVVSVPQSTGGVRRPYPLRHDSISLVTYGRGWILSVPPPLVEKARALCSDLSFQEMMREGDLLAEEWYERLDTDEETERPSAGAYPVIARVAEQLRLRGWSHYYHWYCDPSSWNGEPLDGHVLPITQDDPGIWEQRLKWPGPVGGPGNHKRFEFSDAFGYVLDGRLVSAAQLLANGEDFAWEFGPSTLPEFRRRGFATEAARTATAFIINCDRIPWYYYDHYNRASARLPQKLGFFFYAEGLFSHC